MTKTFLFDTWSFFRSHLISIMLIVFPFTVPLEIFSFLYYQNADFDEAGLGGFIPLVVYLLFSPIFSAGVVFYIAGVIHDRYITTTQAWALATKYWPSYLFLTVILTLVIGFGFALFILPGIFLAARFAFSEFHLLLEDRAPAQSLQSSWDSTREYFWVLVSGGLVITTVIYGPYFLLSFLFSAPALYADLFDSVFSILESLLLFIYTIYAFRVFDFATRQRNHSPQADT